MRDLALKWIDKELKKGRRDLAYAEKNDRPLVDRHNLQAKVQVLEWLQGLAEREESDNGQG